MATYLLDTNHASRLLDPTHSLWDRIEAAVEDGHEILVSPGVVAEVQFGVEATGDPALRRRRDEALTTVLGQLGVCPLSLPAARLAGQLRGRLRRQGLQLDAVDAHLAAIALMEGMVLVTSDRDFAPLAGDLVTEDWLD